MTQEAGPAPCAGAFCPGEIGRASQPNSRNQPG